MAEYFSALSAGERKAFAFAFFLPSFLFWDLLLLVGFGASIVTVLPVAVLVAELVVGWVRFKGCS